VLTLSSKRSTPGASGDACTTLTIAFSTTGDTGDSSSLHAVNNEMPKTPKKNRVRYFLNNILTSHIFYCGFENATGGFFFKFLKEGQFFIPLNFLLIIAVNTDFPCG
jgi:hypothetical protein